MTITIPSGRTLPLQAKSGGGFESAKEVVSGGTAPNVSGSIADGQQITISSLTGESFGAIGPALDHYHDGRNGVLDASLSATDAAVGQWDSVSGNSLYKSGGKVRPLATQITAPDALDGKNKIIFTPSTEVFVSFWMKFDTDPTLFGPSFKTAWLLDSESGSQTDYYDLVFMSKNNLTTRWLIGGNTSDNVDETPSGFVDPNEWVRCTFWVKDNGASEMGYFAQLLNASSGQNTQNAPNIAGLKMLDRASLSTSVDRINIFGDLNNNNNGHAVTLAIDGFYVAVGSASRARVEITDKETYSDATMTEAYFCTPDSWSDSEIVATVRSPDNLAGKYLHIHDANGNHTNGGTGRLIS